MVTKIQNWGNKLALSIPKSFAQNAFLVNVAQVDINLVKGKIIISAIGPPEISLDDLFNRLDSKNIHDEIRTGTPVGKELW